MTSDFINRENLRQAEDDLDNSYLLEAGVARKRLLLGMGEAAAREVTVQVLNERIRLAKLPFKTPKQQNT